MVLTQGIRMKYTRILIYFTLKTLNNDDDDDDDRL